MSINTDRNKPCGDKCGMLNGKQPSLNEKLKKRLIFCADRRFPRGDAGGNRILNMAKIFREIGYEVIITSIGASYQEDYDAIKKKYFYQGIQYENTKKPAKLLAFLQRYIFSSFQVIKILKKIELSSSDKMVLYTTNPIFGFIVCNYAYKKVKADVLMDVVELFQAERYRFYLINPKYWIYRFFSNPLYCSTGKVIAISRLLEEYFIKKGCKVYYIPGVTDISDYQVPINYDKYRLKLIYSGNPGKKEDLTLMFTALSKLSCADKDKIELHFCGVSRKTIERIMGKEAQILKKILDMTIFHPWMEYAELIATYSSMDFLYLLRRDTISTNANFPSKLPEVMACGVSVIANKVGDFYKYLDAGVDSIILELSTVECAMQALHEALSLKPEARVGMRKAARLTAKRSFDYHVWIETARSI